MMPEVQIVPLTVWETEWVESRLSEQLAWMNSIAARYPLGPGDRPYTEDEVRTYLTKIAIKGRL